jgi:peroxisomal 2,4-dienoyl-CoA reductase
MPSASIGANLKYPDFLLSGDIVANVKGQKKSKL